ncbi:hypothetical protein F7725_027536 [Dissostichus mawsoni]|uniref:F1F0-ATP synthase delta subunit C-terminal domain-containing protein n=1 Tax=Dissostichus mawsoni TaxID=36200 RepID=A0A7J5XFB1_DISMA|nr:hypothetical protein F7725_027536 [Dissostichus mawsoni]
MASRKGLRISVIHLNLIKIPFSDMMAARILRRTLPVVRQARSYADVFFKEASVKQVDVPHSTVLRPGVVTIFNDDGSATKYFVSSGSITVNADSSVQLLVEEAATLDQLDIDAAKANLEQAQSEMSGISDEAGRAAAQISLEAHEAIVKALA